MKIEDLAAALLERQKQFMPALDWYNAALWELVTDYLDARERLEVAEKKIAFLSRQFPADRDRLEHDIITQGNRIDLVQRQLDAHKAEHNK